MEKYKAKISTNTMMLGVESYDLFSKTKQILEADDTEVTVLVPLGIFTEAMLLAEKENIIDMLVDINDKLAAILLVKTIV